MDTVFTVACLITQSVCLGLVVYVVRGWRKRMKSMPARVTHSPKRMGLER